MAGSTFTARARRVIVKSRFALLKRAGPASVSTHLRSIVRDAVTRTREGVGRSDEEVEVHRGAVDASRPTDPATIRLARWNAYSFCACTTWSKARPLEPSPLPEVTRLPIHRNVRPLDQRARCHARLTILPERGTSSSLT